MSARRRPRPPVRRAAHRAEVADGRIARSSSPSPTCRAGCRASASTRRTSSSTCFPHGTEGCNYLLAVDVDMNTVDGYADVELAQRVRRLRDGARPRHLRRVPWHPATAMVQADVTWLDGRDVVASRARCSSASSPRLADAAWRRTSARSSSSSSSTTPTRSVEEGLPDMNPANLYNVDYSIIGTSRSSRCCADPPGDGRRGPAGRERQGRVQLRPARDRVPLRGRAAYLRQPRRLQDRREGDRRAGGLRAHVHGEVQRARGQLLPHPPVVPRHRRRAGDGRQGRRSTDCPTSGGSSSPGQLAHLRELSRCSPQHQQLQALRPGLFARPPSSGAATTAPARCASSAAARACASRTACPAATATLPRRRRDGRGRASTASRRAWSCVPRRRATPTPPRARRCRGASRTPSTSGRVGLGGRDVRRRGQKHYANMGRIEIGTSPAPSPTGRGTAVSSASAHPATSRPSCRRTIGRHHQHRTAEEGPVTALHDVISPVTEEVVASVPSLSLEETDAAIARSRTAFETWRHVAPGDRGGSCAGSPCSSTSTSRSSLRSRCATPGTRSATPAGRRATSATCWPTTPAPRSGCSATRSRWRAASTSRSTSRSASSASSCRGTSRCRSPAGVRAGAGRRQHRCSSPPSSRRSPRCASPSSASRQGCPRACSRCSRAGGRSWASASSPPGRREGRVHRVDRGRGARRRGLRPQVKPVTLELGGKSANVIFADADLAAGRRHARRTRCSTTRGPGLLRAVAHPRRALGHGRVPRAARARGARRPRRGPEPRHVRRWAAHQRGAPGLVSSFSTTRPTS